MSHSKSNAATRDVGFNNIGFIRWSTRGVFVLITLLLLRGTVRAGQSPLQITAEELQQRGDLIGAENALQSALKEARAAGPRNVKVAGALAALGVFYQDIGRFSQAESSFTRSLEIMRENTSQDDPALAPLIIHLAGLYVETG